MLFSNSLFKSHASQFWLLLSLFLAILTSFHHLFSF